MAPEYLHEVEISTKSDIYSLGILILEVITGKKNRQFIAYKSGEPFIENVRTKTSEKPYNVLFLFYLRLPSLWLPIPTL